MSAATPRKSPAKPKPLKAPRAETQDPQLLAKASRISRQLADLYPTPGIPLDHASSFQLLVAVMLSAQTTDKKVNTVTPPLFDAAPDAAAMAAMQVADIQQIIKPIGLAPTKAKNLHAAAQMLLDEHAGEVPATFEALEALPGVGHKTASVVMSQAHGHPAFPVDTHIHRLAQRWGLSDGSSVEQTEADLKALLPQHDWHDAHLRIIYFGREHCPAQRHDPRGCPICSWAAGEPRAAAGKGKGRKRVASAAPEPGSGAAAAGGAAPDAPGAAAGASRRRAARARNRA